MLLIQEIDLTWGKEERGGECARVRQSFPLAWPMDKSQLEGAVTVQRLSFFQKGETILDAAQESRKSLEVYLPHLGFSPEKIQREIEQRLFQIRQNRFQSYSSTAELNLTNLSLTPSGTEMEVTFFYDEHRSGMPHRRGHNKDYCCPQSPLYGKDCLNETAFSLAQGQYGRIVWNERRTDYDTREWYYQLHVYNLICMEIDQASQAVFTEREPDLKYEQLAVLY